MPKAPMAVGCKLSRLGEAFKRFLLPRHVISGDELTDVGLDDHEAAIRPFPFDHRLLAKSFDVVVLEAEQPETDGRYNGGDGYATLAAGMELQQRGNIDVANAVAVGEAEPLVADIRQDAFQPAAGLGVLAGIDERDAPRLGVGLMFGDCLGF